MSNAPSHDESFRREIDARVGRTLCQRYTLERCSASVDGGRLRRRASQRQPRRNQGAPHRARCLQGGSRALRPRGVCREPRGASRRSAHPRRRHRRGRHRLHRHGSPRGTDARADARPAGHATAGRARSLDWAALEVLAAAHEKGIVHRDIEPSNLFVTQSRALRVMDFGIARLADGSRLPTRIGHAPDSSSYVAPEQARGEHALVDPRPTSGRRAPSCSARSPAMSSTPPRRRRW